MVEHFEWLLSYDDVELAYCVRATPTVAYFDLVTKREV